MSKKRKLDNRAIEEQWLGDFLKAVCFAAEKHKHQRHKGDGSSYICHPLGVAQILWDEGSCGWIDIMTAAVLHNTLENTDTTEDELNEIFGEEITKIVVGCTNDKSLPIARRKQLQIEHAAKVDVAVCFVKTAVTIHSMRDLLNVLPKGWSLEHIQGYFVWGKALLSAIPVKDARLVKAENEIYKQTITFEGKKYPVLPDCDHKEFLKKYYDLLSKKNE